MKEALKVNHVALNSQQDCFVTSSDKGVKVYNTQSLCLLRSIEADLTGNARIACILHRSNLICFVGGGSTTKYPANTAMVWDDKKKKIIIEYTVPGGPILNVLMSTTRLVIVQAKRVHIFSFPNKSKCIMSEDIHFNPTGIAAMSVDDDLIGQQLAFPGFKIGSVRLLSLKNLNEFESLSPTTIDAHLTEVTQLAMNNQGTLLATGSTKGTVIRVYETRTQNLLTELRRGKMPAVLTSITFSPCSSFLAVSSQKGTLHVFGIRENENVNTGTEVLKRVGLRGNSNLAQVTIKSKVLNCGFTNATSKSLQSIFVVCADGTYHRYAFGTNGHTQRESFDQLPQFSGEQEFWSVMP